MNWAIGAFFVGVTSFVATNIDDIVVLMVFFSQLNARFRRRHVILGQYLGFFALLLASLPGYFGGLAISKPWLGLLGFLPIFIGVSQLIQGPEDEPNIQDISRGLSDVAVPVSVGSKLKTLLSPQTYAVAAVTIANGGDNIGIYVPLFASSSLPQLAVIMSVFFLLVGVWCFAAERLVQQKAIACGLAQYGHSIVPFVFIALGLYILAESQTYRLLTIIQVLDSTDRGAPQIDLDLSGIANDTLTGSSRSKAASAIALSSSTPFSNQYPLPGTAFYRYR